MQIVKIFTILAIMFLGFSGIFPREIGQRWEFNTTGNTEGWNISPTFTDLAVADGSLQATVTGEFPYFLGPEFELSASDYGFILMRMKAAGATSVIFYWKNTSGGFAKHEIVGDSAFHAYAIPVYQNRNWTGTIQGINRITVNAPVGTRIEIDYIRILRLGFNPQVMVFSPLRTVLKPNQAIPVHAVVANQGDRGGSVMARLQLPDAIQLVEGESSHILANLAPGSRDTLNWTLQSTQTDSFNLELKLNVADTLFSQRNLPFSITDRYWQQDEFFLSAWSPPRLTTAAYDYYSHANFDLVLSLPLDESAVSRVEQYKMRCLLRAGSILGEHQYLRAPENEPPEALTPAHLAKLDAYIEQFRNRDAVLGYYLTDEPNAHAFENLGKAVAYLREKDPTRLSFINLFPTYATEEQLGTENYDEHVRQFIETVKPELLSYDHYHFFNGYDGTGYFHNLGIIRHHALTYDIPFCNIIQAIGADFLNWRIPTPAEHRWLVYTSLAYGAKALIWFHWDHEWGLTSSPARDQLFNSIQALNQEIKTLGPVLLKLKSDAVYHSLNIPKGGVPLPADALVQSVSPNADLVIGLFSDENEKQFLMLMNKRYTDSVSTEITLAGTIPAVKVFDLVTGNWQPVTTEITDTGTRFVAGFRLGGGRLFALEEATAVTPSKARMPRKTNLLRNFPNPFNAGTRIEYDLAESGPVKISVYDTLGREIVVLLDEKQTAGLHHLTWDAKNLASGTYLLKLKTSTGERVRKLTLVK